MRLLHALAVLSLTTTTMMVTMLAAPLAMDLMLTVVSTALMVAVTAGVAVDVVAVEAGAACKHLLTSLSTSTEHALHTQVVKLYFCR
jgi:citrate lyase alpha subunit